MSWKCTNKYSILNLYLLEYSRYHPSYRYRSLGIDPLEIRINRALLGSSYMIRFWRDRVYDICPGGNDEEFLKYVRNIRFKCYEVD